MKDYGDEVMPWSLTVESDERGRADVDDEEVEEVLGEVFISGGAKAKGLRPRCGRDAAPAAAARLQGTTTQQLHNSVVDVEQSRQDTDIYITVQ